MLIWRPSTAHLTLETPMKFTFHLPMKIICQVNSLNGLLLIWEPAYANLPHGILWHAILFIYETFLMAISWLEIFYLYWYMCVFSSSISVIWQIVNCVKLVECASVSSWLQSLFSKYFLNDQRINDWIIFSIWKLMDILKF